VVQTFDQPLHRDLLPLVRNLIFVSWKQRPLAIRRALLGRSDWAVSCGAPCCDADAFKIAQGIDIENKNI